MSEEEKIKISVNEEDVQNLINCYKKDIEYIMQLEKENQKYKEVIDKAIEWVRNWTDDKNDWFYEDSKPSELLDILKEVE